MMQRIVLALCVVLTSLIALCAQSHGDCKSSLHICNFGKHEILQMYGVGSIEEVINPSCARNLRETNCAWLSWKTNSSGNIFFDIDPLLPEDDIDFVLYRKLDKSCTNLEELRCMASGMTFGDPLSSRCLGSTGLSMHSNDYSENSGCSDSNDNYVKFLNVHAGEEYVLFVNNYDSAAGFVFSIEGTSRLEKSPTCYASNITDDLNVEVYPVPTKDYLNILFSAVEKSDVRCRLLDITGRELISKYYSLEKGNSSDILNLDKLAPGLMFLEIHHEGRTITKRITKH